MWGIKSGRGCLGSHLRILPHRYGKDTRACERQQNNVPQLENNRDSLSSNIYFYCVHFLTTLRRFELESIIHSHRVHFFFGWGGEEHSITAMT